MWAHFCVVFAIAAVSLGQDCTAPPPIKDECCVGMPEYVTNAMIEVCDNDEDQLPCDVATCFMKQANFIGAEGKIDKAVVKSYVQKTMTPEWSGIVEGSLEQCFTESAAAKCESQTFLPCITFAMMKNCPAASWRQTDDCAALKTFVEKCPVPYGSF